MDQARADLRGRAGDGAGPRAMDRVETLARALEQDADEVDDDGGVAHRGLDRGRMAHVGLHGMDLADPAERLQMPRELGPAHRDADAVMALRKCAHHVPAQKPGAAEDGDEHVDVVHGPSS